MSDHKPLFEREDALELLHESLALAERGRGTLVMLEGPAGVGKTTLLEEIRAAAARREFNILAGRGKEREREVPLVMVEGLFGTFMRNLDEAEQSALLAGSAALAVPLLDQVVDVPHDSASLFEGLFWLTANLAEQSPVAILIDDGRWVDAASMRFLSYLAARVEDLPVAVVVATRTYEPELMASVIELRQHPGCRRLQIGALSQAASEDLVRGVFAQATHRFCSACFEATGGNPFYLTALLEDFSGDVVMGADDEIDRVRDQGPSTVAESVHRRLSLMDPGAVRLAQSVAVLDEEAELDHAARLARIDIETALEWAAALTATGILRPSEPLSFVHPIVRLSTYKDIAPPERARAHEDAVRVLDASAAPPEKIAPHVLLAGTVEGIDTDGILRAAAARAKKRGSPAIAIDYLQRVLAGSMSVEDRVQVLVELGEAEAMSGSPRAASRSAEAANLCSDPGQRAGARLRIAKALIGAGLRREAAGVVDPGFEELGRGHQRLRRELEATYVFAGFLEPSLQDATRRRIENVVEGAVDDVLGVERAVLAQAAFSLCASGRERERAVALARRAYGNGALIEDEGGDGMTVPIVSGVLFVADELEAAISVSDRAIADARARGLVNGFATACHNRSYPLRLAGRIPDAIADAQQAIDAHRLGWRLFLVSAYAQLAHALMDSGDLPGAGSVIGSVSDDDHRHRPEFGLFLEARGRWHLLHDRNDDAVVDLSEARRRIEQNAFLNALSVGSWRLYLGTAAVRTKNFPLAESLVDDAHLERARLWGAPRAVSLALRVAGLARGGTAGVDMLREAVTYAERSEATVEHAHALVDLGRGLNKLGERTEAREWLLRGFDRAREQGALLLAGQTLKLIAEAGGRPRRLEVRGVGALTPGERRVADLVATGLSNRAVAEALFVTVKAVEAHLSKVYRKLGIARRAELAGVLAGDGPGELEAAEEGHNRPLEGE